MIMKKTAKTTKTNALQIVVTHSQRILMKQRLRIRVGTKMTACICVILQLES